MPLSVRIQLMIMMFLEFFVWGAWAVTMGSYLMQGLEFSGTQVSTAYATTGWAAIVSPFFMGMVADRFFPAQRVLGVLHLLGAVLMFAAASVSDFGLFFMLLLGYALCYMPTLALVNAIAFSQMNNPEKEFPPVRTLGTVGWIVAGLTITFVLSRFVDDVEATALPLKMAGAASLVLGLFSFSLPNTPPPAKGKKVTVSDILGLQALGLMKRLSFAVFVVCSLLVCIPLAFYYTFTNPFLNEVGMEQVAAKMSLGQMSEVFFMLVMPFFFARLGVKKMLLIGMLAWVGRYVLFAFGDTGSMVWMFYGGILLHGICYDFFFVTGQIYVDNEAPKDVRASAQGFIALVTYGVGMVIGNLVAGLIVDAYTTTGPEGVISHDWRTVWLIPAFMALVVALAFALLFRDTVKPKDVEGGAGAAG